MSKKSRLLLIVLSVFETTTERLIQGHCYNPEGFWPRRLGKKLGQKARVDYRKYLAEQGKEDTFLDLVNFINEHHQIAQRFEREFAKVGKQKLLSLTPTRWMPVKMTVLSKEVRLIMPSSMPKESQVANLPAHPPRRKVEIREPVKEVGRHLPETTRN